MPISPLDDLRVEEWEQMIDINIKGVLYGIAAALPVFRKQGSGRLRQGRKKTVAGAICADNTPKDQKALWRVFSFIGIKLVFVYHTVSLEIVPPLARSM